MRRIIATEGEWPSGFVFDSGSIWWQSDDIPITSFMDDSLLGMATDLAREGNDITAEIKGFGPYLTDDFLKSVEFSACVILKKAKGTRLVTSAELKGIIPIGAVRS